MLRKGEKFIGDNFGDDGKQQLRRLKKKERNAW